MLTPSAHDAGDVERKLLHALAEQVKMLSFTPGWDQLEYVLQRKKNSAIVGIFNHGAIPIGSDSILEVRAKLDMPMVSKIKGPWSGEIVADIRNMGLPKGREYEVHEAHGLCGKDLREVVEKGREFWLTPVKSTQKDGKIRFRLTIQERSEIIIGPRGLKGKEFF